MTSRKKAEESKPEGAHPLTPPEYSPESVELAPTGEAKPIEPPDDPDGVTEAIAPSDPPSYEIQRGVCPACGQKARTGLYGDPVCADPGNFPECPRNQLP